MESALGLTVRADKVETSASEQKGVMQSTGTLLKNVACFACFRLRSGLAMWFVH